MKPTTKSILFCLLLFLAAFKASAATAPGPMHRNNGAFLGHAYVSSASFIKANVPTMATRMQVDFATNRLFIICGNIDASGRLAKGPAAVPQVAAFLNAIAAWESANPGYHFQLFAYLSGDLDSKKVDFVDVSKSAVRDNIATESIRFTSSTVAGSYLGGTSRSFDGVFIDFEPAGGTTTTAMSQFGDLVKLMDGIKIAIAPGKLIAFAAPQFSERAASAWFWTPAYYYSMASHVDVLIAMEYDTKLTTGSAYQSWIQAQTVSILQAISGEYWEDGSHAAPAHCAQLLFGFPAFPNRPPNHFAAAETIQYAAQGVTAGLATLDARARNSFSAAIVYLTTDGTGSDGYASYRTDWNDLVHTW